MRLRYFILIVFLFFGLPSYGQTDTAPKINPGDSLALRVVVFDPEVRAHKLWDVLGGTYKVQADGTVHLPLAGPLSAVGRTLIEFEDQLEEALASAATTVDVSAQFAGFAPLFIFGAIKNPGQYEARPGLTALQALAIAGGTTFAPRQEDRQGRVLSQDVGALHSVLNDLARLSARQERLRQEIAGAESLTFPDTPRPYGKPELIAAIQEEERAIFDSRRDALSRQEAAIDALRELLKQELSTLEQKLPGVEMQLSLAEANLARTEALSDRGLSVSSALANAQDAVINTQLRQLDLENNLFSARQELAKTDRDKVALLSQRTADNVAGLQNVNARIEQLEVRRATLMKLLADQGADVAATLDLDTAKPQIFLLQRDGASLDNRELDGAELLQGGDVIQIVVDYIEADP